MAKKSTPKTPAIPTAYGIPVTDLTQLCLPDALAVPLHKALSMRRGADTPSEAAFVAWLTAHCSQYADLLAIDGAGNLHFRVLKPDGEQSKTLFIAHTDTVTSNKGAGCYLIDGGILRAGASEDCLGADNGAGLSLLVNMMTNGVPGYFIFSRSEEIGGVGAKYLADNFASLLSQHSRAITFDRRGTADVITHQSGGRCCSDVFAWALADALNDRGLLYAPSDKGVYTDTREFTGYISECTNVSTGYFQEHGTAEHLDLDHYCTLAAATLTIDWESLPTERTAQVERSMYAKPYAVSTAKMPGLFSRWDDEPQTYDDYSIFDDIAEAQAGSPAALRERLAEELYPEDILMALRYIDIRRIKDADYDKTMDMQPEQILGFLLEIASVQEAML